MATWNEEEINYSTTVCDDGVYPFTVKKAEIKVSKKGKPYINLQLNVDVDGEARTLFGMLMPAYPRALKQFCAVVGVARPTTTREDELLEFCDNIVGSEGYVRTVNKAQKAQPGEEEPELRTEVAGFQTSAE